MSEISRATFFYLIIGKEIDSDFYKFASEFQAQGSQILPVNLDQLTRLLKVAGNETLYVITSVKSFKQKNEYEQNTLKMINLLLKAKRINFFLFSSFSQLNQIAVFHTSKNYSFFKYPVLLGEEVTKLIKFYLYKENKKQLWPGGKRARLPDGQSM